MNYILYLGWDENEVVRYKINSDQKRVIEELVANEAFHEDFIIDIKRDKGLKAHDLTKEEN